MLTALLWACGALTLILAGYSAGHYLVAAVFLARRPAREPAAARPDLAVAVLVAARDEGAQAVRVVRSLLLQDHPGPVAIHLLLRDATDTSLPFLAAAFPGLDPGGAPLELQAAPCRTLGVELCGAGAKSAKLNAIIPRIEAPFTAILDCDHQARPGWLRGALACMEQRGARMVQGRRGPLRALGLFPLWDSLHQHVGCELFNAAFSRLGLTVYFTGTTAVAETALLRDNPFRDCITEDVDLSYHLLMQGVRIAADPGEGSDEEVSPDLASFLARRRRWAHGHTEAFLRHLPRLGQAPLSWAQKLQFLFHGVHYLVCAVVFALHLLIGAWFLLRLSPGVAAAAVTGAALAALPLVHSQRAPRWGTRLSEFAVLFAWLAPAAVIAMNLTLALLLREPARAALPLPDALQIAGLLGLFAPLAVLLAGLWGFGQLSPGTLLAVLTTWPLAFYLDICGVLLGLADGVLHRPLWHRVTRDAIPTAPGGALVLPGLTVALDLRESWQAREVLAALGEGGPRLLRGARIWPWLGVLGLLGAGLAVGPLTRLPIADRGCEPMQHDADPWIVAPEKIHGYCEPAGSPDRARWTRRSGRFTPARHDEFSPVDLAFWEPMDSTFPCNLVQFTPENAVPLPGGGLALEITPEPRGDRAASGADLVTRDDAHFRYGRFEVRLKPARGSGLISAFFLYRFDPWQEIDTEFLGRDTTKILLNVYYNPGAEGDLYNYGYRGTPVLVDLGFDAAQDFHDYALEWDEDELRWFVDGELIHRRRAGRPTPIPHLPMRLHLNAWASCSEELAGPFDPAALPVQAEIRSLTLSTRGPSPWARVLTPIDRLLSAEDEPVVWQDGAGWLRGQTP